MSQSRNAIARSAVMTGGLKSLEDLTLVLVATILSGTMEQKNQEAEAGRKRRPRQKRHKE